MLEPFIFTLYTADCRTQDVNYPLIKLPDNTTMTGLIHNNYDTKYRLHLKSFVDYFHLNISKTKELFMDFCRTASPPSAVLINRVEVKRASSY